jgi:SAM-dependent methyltransferase
MQNERDKVGQREKLLAEIGKDQSLIALSPEDVREIDRQLSSNWGFKYYPRRADLFNVLDQPEDQGAVERFWDAHNEAAAKLTHPPGTADNFDEEIYDTIAPFELLGPITSQRRPFILDAIAMSIGLSRCLGVTEGILDVGCHTGLVTNLLSERLRPSAVGIDPREPTIEFAKRFKRPLSAGEFVHTKLPWKTSHRFEMIIAIDSMPSSEYGTGRFWASVSELLEPNGLAIVVRLDWLEAAKTTLKQLRRAALGFGYADVVRGFGGIPPHFETTRALVFLKGGHFELPPSVLAREWNLHFSDCANACKTPMLEKSQAFERALRKIRRVLTRQLTRSPSDDALLS